METVSFIYNDYGLNISVDAYFRVLTYQSLLGRRMPDEVELEATEFDTDFDVDNLLVRRFASLPTKFDTIRGLIDQKAHEEWENR